MSVNTPVATWITLWIVFTANRPKSLPSGQSAGTKPARPATRKPIPKINANVFMGNLLYGAWTPHGCKGARLARRGPQVVGAVRGGPQLVGAVVGFGLRPQRLEW